jgi:hypothetical protein
MSRLGRAFVGLILIITGFALYGMLSSMFITGSMEAFLAPLFPIFFGLILIASIFFMGDN